MPCSDLLIEHDEAVMIITLARPQQLNAITKEMLDALLDAVRAFGADDRSRVLLIRALGKYFSSGADLNAMKASGTWTSPRTFRQAYRAGSFTFHPLGDEIEAIEKPVVVAHQGACLGGALELSLSCDFRLASNKAHYSLPEIKLGLIPGSGGTSRLTRLVGAHWARWLVMAGREIDAAQALAIGLIHDVYPDEQFEERVRTFCKDLSALPAEAMGTAKLAIELAADLDRAQARQVERLANSTLILGAEHLSLMERLLARIGRK